MTRPAATMRKDLADSLAAAMAASADQSIARAALLIAGIEYPDLDPAPYLARLDAMGRDAAQAIERHVVETGDRSVAGRLRCLNAYLFDREGFTGNRHRYEDPRNSCLNEVLDRRTGIPLTLSLVYMEVARRAGLWIEGVNFPGHFLVSCPDASPTGLIIDPFDGGTVLTEQDCRRMFERHVGSGVPFDRDLLAAATPSQIVVRMLLNLKRIYVHMRSFPQARDVTELLMVVSPSAHSELRDRGLLAYHLNDLPRALQDLQTYLQLSGAGELDDESKTERKQIWEHVKTLRRRMAGLN
ncbi:MAG: tetratricopeptide repeat protein [Acidimicrobiia bacterium]|nr:tetratricopeptide repeat protein [Acidimicrobiia bacterium]